MSLPQPWVDRIFEKLVLLYGQQFLARWRDLDIASVKADWARELDGFERHPHAIAHALRCLPLDEPPTVLRFRALCRAAPEPVVPHLAPPPADPLRAATALAQLRKAPDSAGIDHKAWARRIVMRHAAGQRVARHSLGAARMALLSAPATPLQELVMQPDNQGGAHEA